MVKRIISLFLIIAIALSFSSCKSNKYKLLDENTIVAPNGTLYHRYDKLDNYNSEITDFDNYLGEIERYKAIDNADGIKVGVYSLNSDNNDFICVCFGESPSFSESTLVSKDGDSIYVRERVEFSYSDISDVFDVQLHITHNYMQSDYNSYNVIDGIDEAELVEQILSSQVEHCTEYEFMGAYISYRKKSLENVLIKRNLYYSHAPEEGWRIFGYLHDQYALDDSFLDAFNISDEDLKVLEERIQY